MTTSVLGLCVRCAFVLLFFLTRGAPPVGSTGLAIVRCVLPHSPCHPLACAILAQGALQPPLTPPPTTHTLPHSQMARLQIILTFALAAAVAQAKMVVAAAPKTALACRAKGGLWSKSVCIWRHYHMLGAATGTVNPCPPSSGPVFPRTLEELRFVKNEFCSTGLKFGAEKMLLGVYAKRTSATDPSKHLLMSSEGHPLHSSLARQIVKRMVGKFTAHKRCLAVNNGLGSSKIGAFSCPSSTYEPVACNSHPSLVCCSTASPTILLCPDPSVTYCCSTYHNCSGCVSTC